MSEERTKRTKKGKKKLNWSNRKKITISLVSVLAVIICLLLGGYYYVKGKIYTEYKPSKLSEDVNYKEVEGITNVLLLGTDGRTLDEASRADSIIIATLDSNNKKIKLTSLFRDTLVNIPGYGEYKLNAAMMLGGPELVIDTIRETYGINIDKYLIINFWGFEAVIDQIGGIEVDIKDYQLEELNKYIGESTTGNDCPVTETGLQTLNGKQALSYARIRKGVGDEFERTSRQQEVIMKVAEKLRTTKPSKYLGIMNKMLDHIKTNIDPIEALNYAYTIYKFPSLVTEQLQIPQPDLSEGRLYKDLGWVFLMDGPQNAQILQDFIFEDKIPNIDDFDYYSLNSVLAQYEADENSYNKLHGINPEDYENKDQEKLPEKQPEEVKPEEPKPEEPKPEETINIGSLISVDMDINTATGILAGNGISYTISGTGTIVTGFTQTIKKGETVVITVKELEQPKPEETIHIGSLISVGMDVNQATGVLASNGISYSISGNGTLVAGFTETIKKGETVVVTVKEAEQPQHEGQQPTTP